MKLKASGYPFRIINKKTKEVLFGAMSRTVAIGWATQFYHEQPDVVCLFVDGKEVDISQEIKDDAYLYEPETDDEESEMEDLDIEDLDKIESINTKEEILLDYADNESDYDEQEQDIINGLSFGDGAEDFDYEQ